MMWHQIMRQSRGRYFTSEINNYFSQRFMAKLCVWQRAGVRDRAVNRRLGFGSRDVLLWSNLRLWNCPPGAAEHLLTKTREQLQKRQKSPGHSQGLGLKERGKHLFLFLIYSIGVGSVLGQVTTQVILSDIYPSTWRISLLLSSNNQIIKLGEVLKGIRIRWLFFGVNSLQYVCASWNKIKYLHLLLHPVVGPISLPWWLTGPSEPLAVWLCGVAPDTCGGEGKGCCAGKLSL